jgi:response regulator RpfG family c-di-GMP phosphodiesterase
MLTATSDIETIQQTSALGVKDYIKKPFLPKNLVERVEKKLAQEHSEEILIFGDDEDELKSMKNIIEENFSHEALIVTSILDAEKILHEQQFSLILSCANMQFINGFKFLKLLASEEKFNEIPFALTTPDKILELLNKINQPEFKEEVIHSDKKKIAHVVTNLIGYALT